MGLRGAQVVLDGPQPEGRDVEAEDAPPGRPGHGCAVRLLLYLVEDAAAPALPFRQFLQEKLPWLGN